MRLVYEQTLLQCWCDDCKDEWYDFAAYELAHELLRPLFKDPQGKTA